MKIPDPIDENEPKSQQLELGEDEYIVALKKTWERILRILSVQFNKNPTFENFIRPLKPLSYDGKIIVMGAPSSFAREWAEKKHSQMLKLHLEQMLGVSDLQLRFTISSSATQPILGEKPIPLQQAASPHSSTGDRSLSPLHYGNDNRSGKRNALLFELSTTPLNDRYTFDQFVTGRSNRLAHAGSMAVALSPGKVYNPLFLYGNPGLGKTHLMHAIAHEIRANMPEARVAYVSGETFTNHYVGAIREQRTEDFRRAYRNVDVWLIDDIQTLATKDQTKEEFFHTFNTLHQSDRQIVIASDRSPRDLRMMEDRLRSRFECGLVADVATPELETRMAILQRKAKADGQPIPEEVIWYMANLIQSNIRALEGALIKLVAYASVTHSPVTEQLAAEVLSSYFVDRPPTPGGDIPVRGRYLSASTPGAISVSQPGPGAADSSPTIGFAGVSVDRILQATSSELKLSREAILAGGSRQKEAVFARQIAMYLCREMTTVPMAVLATTFGCKHHSAISHAHAKCKDQLKSDSDGMAIVARIRKALEFVL